ncbi:MAG: HDOD domain-containing protein [Myxococcales bacterium]|nr:HDOD domain-containing protein [Myxococcales bacterium]
MLGRRRAKKSELNKLIDSYELGSFGNVVQEALSTLRDPDSDLVSVGHVISADPGLSVQVLKIVNSPGFGLRHTVADPGHASALMGRANLESLLITAGVKNVLSDKRLRGFDPRRFWQSAARRASVTRAFGNQMGLRDLAGLFTAALLQDVAIPLLCAWLGDEYGEVVERWHRGEASLHSLEQSKFGWDHAEVGGAIAEKWGLPSEIQKAIYGHHPSPDDPEPAPLPIVLGGLLPEVDWNRAYPAIIAMAKMVGKLDESDAQEVLEVGIEGAGEVMERIA